jgi:hypothetical protein
MNRKTLLIALSLFAATVFSQTAFAQGLNWEGQTGALITPFAYTAGSPAGKFGKPEVAFHYLNAGNALNSDQRWQGRLFGAAAFVVKGPAKSALIFGAEALQEPRYVQGLNDYLTGSSTSRVSANIPTSFTYFVRVVPHVAGSRLQVDLGVAQFAGKIAPGVLPTLDARARVGTGISYHF